jgi:hypothetical protein
MSIKAFIIVVVISYIIFLGILVYAYHHNKIKSYRKWLRRIREKEDSDYSL